MALKDVTGNQHVDQLITELRNNPLLRDRPTPTADGNLYTIKGDQILWAVTRFPQNLILSNIEQAYRRFVGECNYFPDNEAARASFEHKDTIVVDLEKLLSDWSGTQEYCGFRIDPEAVDRLNPEQRRVAQRIYGPDEENFGLNMEMFAEAKRILHVTVLQPNYVHCALRRNDRKFLARASKLDYYDFSAIERLPYSWCVAYST